MVKNTSRTDNLFPFLSLSSWPVPTGASLSCERKNGESCHCAFEQNTSEWIAEGELMSLSETLLGRRFCFYQRSFLSVSSDGGCALLQSLLATLYKMRKVSRPWLNIHWPRRTTKYTWTSSCFFLFILHGKPWNCLEKMKMYCWIFFRTQIWGQEGSRHQLKLICCC